ncbi:VOC family protein [Halobacillus fulvus]|nr:VOC family protein [Halobacillus fulvus]
MELTHIRLLVDDYQKSFLFYRDVLGFEVEWGDGHSNYADFKGLGGAKLAIFERKQMEAALGNENYPRTEQDHSLVIFRVKSVDNFYNEWKNDIAFLSEPVSQPEWMIKVIHFRDPDGNLIELNEPL